MDRRAVLAITLTLMLTSMLTLAFNIKPVRSEPDTITVPDDYPTIQEAINAAVSGDTISVRAGTYYEHLTIDRPISLIGEDAQTTIIDGDATIHAVVNVTTDNVNISGFTIQNKHKGEVGIWLYRSRNCTVVGNNVRNIGGIGIALDYCMDCVVERNNVSDNNLSGIALYFSKGCTVFNNNVDKNNKFAGIDIYSCGECTIVGNILNNNENRGIKVYNSGHCIFKDNNITGSNRNFGIYGSELSHFVNDIDISNTINGEPVVYLINEYDCSVNPSTYPAIGYLAVVNSTNITVENLTLRHNEEGVLFAYTSNSIIRRVTTSHNEYGIHIVNCDNCTVTENTATNNIIGIRLWYSNNNVVTGNTATYNSHGIILSECRNCVVSGNQEQAVLFWMQWWFWTIVAAGIIALAGAIYFLKKRKPPKSITPTPPIESIKTSIE